MSITTVSQSQLGQDTAINSQVVTTVVKNFTNGTLGSGPNITSVVVTDSNYNNLDDTAVTTSNGYIKIIGTGFTSAANVYIGANAVPAANVTFVSSTEIRARVPVLSVGNYSLSLFNSNSSGTISSSTFIVSTGPVWVTSSPLANQVANTAFGVNLSATSDSNITYANTTVLPAGTSLLANGYFYGTVTIGVQTTYSFDVKANDVENQDASRTFSVTVTVPQPAGLYMWGYNSQGLSGLNDAVTFRSSPVQVGTDTWNKVSHGSLSVMGIKTNGTLWTWGWNNYGQLGQSDLNNRSSPTQIGSGTNWSLASVGQDVHMATKTDGTLWLWGINQYGQLGQNDRGALNGTTQRSSPVQVGSGTTWSKISVGRNTAMATKTDGTLWTWGWNQYGQLGHNTVYVNRSSPTQVGAGTTWSQISNGYGMSAAIKTDGTLWTWGNGICGGLGLNNQVLRSSPVQVGVLTTWSLVSTSLYSIIATKTDGTLWAWGRNDNGQLGINDTAYRSSPVQVGSGTTWSLINTSFMTNSGTIATKTDGSLWSWGFNTYGNLGLNDIVSRSSPVQVGAATTWSQISMGQSTGFAIRSA